MLIFHHANLTENLSAAMAHIMASQPLSDPFEEELVLIQSAGMGTWLSQQLARQNGACVNVESVHPASFVWRLIRRLQPTMQTSGLFEKATLRWEILRLLPEKLSQPEYAFMAQYLGSLRGGSSSPSNLLQLAEAAADVFDGYLNYRPDWIGQWEEASPDSGPPASLNTPSFVTAWVWQRDLWRSLYPHMGLSQRHHRAAQIKWLEGTLENLDLAQQSVLPQRLFVFGLHALPPSWLRLFLRLAQYTEIHWFAMNPARHYWGDVLHPRQALRQQQALMAQGIDEAQAGALFVEQNSLLASWGKTGRDYLSLIFALEGESGFVESPADLHDAPDASASALHALQADLFDVQQVRRAVLPTDTSIRFAQCHSRLREVEALHDHLLALLADHSHLAPRDIIVMMPDVEVFAPLIRAIFSREVQIVGGERRALPFAISDQSLAHEQPLIDALSTLFRVSETRLSMHEVFDWLDNTAIAQRFQLDHAECVMLREWLSQLNVRWGLHAQHRDSLLDYTDSSDANTWFKAASRMLSGIVLGSVDANDDLKDFVVTGLPSEAESQEQQLVIGKLCRFLEVLSALQSSLEQKVAPRQGVQLLGDWVHRLIDWDAIEEHARRFLQSSLDALIEQFDRQSLEDIPLQILADAWLESLDESRVSQRFLSGSINFCTLMPMRSIPFKVVAMLGMNEGAFPRQQVPNGLDLMHHDAPRLGDRSRRDDDRYLFLEALCSARLGVYISYEGFSAQDNSERFPSVLVSELREYCGQHFYLTGDEQARAEEAAVKLLAHWTVSHRLQPFHSAYFSASATDHLPSLPQSFAAEWLSYHQSSAQTPGISAQPPSSVEAGTRRLTLDELVSRLLHPLRYFYQSLGVSLYDLPEHDEESEPFVLNGLERYAMKTELAQTWFDPLLRTEQVLYRWQAQDRLPQAPWDEAEFEACQHSLAAQQGVLESYRDLVVQALHRESDGIVVEGRVWCAREARVELNFSKSMAPAFWGAWCRHVLWSCEHGQAHATGESHCVGAESTLVFKPLDSALATQYAHEILEAAKTYEREAQCFAPRTLYALLMESEAKARQALQGVSGRFVMPGELDDAHWQRFFQEYGTHIDDLEALQAHVQDHPLWRQVTAMRDLIEERAL